MIETTESVPPEPSNSQNKTFLTKLKTKLQEIKDNKIKIRGISVSFPSAVKYFFYSLFLKETNEKAKRKKLNYFLAIEYFNSYKKQKQKKLEKEQKTR